MSAPQSKNVEIKPAADDTGELVKSPQTTAMLPPSSMPANAAGWWTSQPVNSFEDKLGLLNLLEARDSDADKFKSGVAVKDLARMPYRFKDENKEDKEIPRYVVIDVSGNTYNVFSPGMVGDIDKLVTVAGRPPWPKPVIFTLNEVDTGKKDKLKKLAFSLAKS